MEDRPTVAVVLAIGDVRGVCLSGHHPNLRAKHGSLLLGDHQGAGWRPPVANITALFPIGCFSHGRASILRGFRRTPRCGRADQERKHFTRLSAKGGTLTHTDEQELLRLTSLLESLHNRLEDEDLSCKEALQKAALALSVSFIHGLRFEVERLYGTLH